MKRTFSLILAVWMVCALSFPSAMAFEEASPLPQEPIPVEYSEEPCTHEGTQSSTSDWEIKVLSTDASSHTLEKTRIYTTYCWQCNKEISRKEFDPHILTETHFVISDTCVDCGYKCTCEHINRNEELLGSYEITPQYLDASSHMVYYSDSFAITCGDCGVRLGQTSRSREAGKEEHSFSSGTCSCGAKFEEACIHEKYHINCVNNDQQPYEYTSYDDAGHYRHQIIECRTICDQCGELLSQEEQTELIRESHTCDNGVCECGYHCEHKDQYVNVIYIDPEFVSFDENGHSMYVCPIYRTYCMNCHSELSEEDGAYDLIYEPHEFMEGSNYCVRYCGYERPCTHPHEPVTREKYTNYGVLSFDESSHTVWGTTYLERYCPDCDMRFDDSDASSLQKLTRPHIFNEHGFCTECNYKKPTPTPTAEPTPTPTAEPTPTPTAEPTPTPTAEPTPVPTAEPTPTPTAEPTPVPTAEPTPTPTVLPAPEPIVNYEEVPTEQVVHGITASEETRMVVAMLTAIEQVYQENENDVTIEIALADKIFTPDEKTLLDDLLPVEQILVLFTAIGHDSEVNYALASMNIGLSEKAQELSDLVQQRLNSASEVERKAFEQSLKENFPIETVTIDGMTYDYFTIELLVETSAGTHAERYGFRCDENGFWIFTRLSIGTFSE